MDDEYNMIIFNKLINKENAEWMNDECIKN